MDALSVAETSIILAPRISGSHLCGILQLSSFYSYQMLDVTWLHGPKI